MSGLVLVATPGQRLTEIDATARSEVTTTGFEVDAITVCIGVTIAACIELPVAAKLLHLILVELLLPSKLVSVLLLPVELISVLLLPAELVFVAFAFSQMRESMSSFTSMHGAATFAFPHAPSAGAACTAMHKSCKRDGLQDMLEMVSQVSEVQSQKKKDAASWGVPCAFHSTTDFDVVVWDFVFIRKFSSSAVTRCEMKKKHY
jgi:hypothetical protein